MQTEFSAKKLYFIRHGQTDMNLQEICIGQFDPLLNETGREQARAFERANGDAIDRFDLIVSSPLLRAFETAVFIKAGRAPRFETHDGLGEWNVGDYAGKYQPELPDFFYGRQDTPGGESYEGYKTRILTTLHEIARLSEDNILVVAHSGLWLVYDDLMKLDRPKADHVTLYELDRPRLAALDLG